MRPEQQLVGHDDGDGDGGDDARQSLLQVWMSGAKRSRPTAVGAVRLKQKRLRLPCGGDGDGCQKQLVYDYTIWYSVTVPKGTYW